MVANTISFKPLKHITMITKTLALVLTMTISFFAKPSIVVPTQIPIDIEYCDFNSGKENVICSIAEAEGKSHSKIYLSKNGKNPQILIDKRTINPDKENFIFKDGKIKIDQRNIINIPYAQISVLIRPGVYDAVKTNRGYLIQL